MKTEIIHRNDDRTRLGFELIFNLLMLPISIFIKQIFTGDTDNQTVMVVMFVFFLFVNLFFLSKSTQMGIAKAIYGVKIFGLFVLIALFVLNFTISFG